MPASPGAMRFLTVCQENGLRDRRRVLAAISNWQPELDAKLRRNLDNFLKGTTKWPNPDVLGLLEGFVGNLNAGMPEGGFANEEPFVDYVGAFLDKVGTTSAAYLSAYEGAYDVFRLGTEALRKPDDEEIKKSLASASYCLKIRRHGSGQSFGYEYGSRGSDRPSWAGYAVAPSASHIYLLGFDHNSPDVASFAIAPHPASRAVLVGIQLMSLDGSMVARRIAAVREASNKSGEATTKLEKLAREWLLASTPNERGFVASTSANHHKD